MIMLVYAAIEVLQIMKTIVLLIMSNAFMTIAWFWHLKYKDLPLPLVILISWSIAFVEYSFQVPAIRWGHERFSAAELKTMQVVFSLTIFSIFSIVYLKEELRWNYIVGFMMLAGGVFFIFKKW